MIPLIGAVFMLAAGPGYAGDGELGLDDGPEHILSHMDKRRDDVRRALLTSGSLPDSTDERRRLSPAERNVLSREWRESLRNVYEERPRKKQ